jgi:hypothetical protein
MTVDEFVWSACGATDQFQEIPSTSRCALSLHQARMGFQILSQWFRGIPNSNTGANHLGSQATATGRRWVVSPLRPPEKVPPSSKNEFSGLPEGLMGYANSPSSNSLQLEPEWMSRFCSQLKSRNP